ncbi:MAG: helix-hairpin-helix domain-containing protein [Sedimentisphaerales bacterium]|nr:helix-hairpin-helix domain-containing protein [Sedimentisphaerales bacterium]
MEDTGIYGSNDRLKWVRSSSFIVAAGLAVVFCVCFVLFGFSAAKPEKTLILEYRINPNNASPASLMRLPGLGLGRANAIIEYRIRFQQDNQGDVAFRDCDDLQKVKGIGPITAGNMCEFLKFE